MFQLTRRASLSRPRRVRFHWLGLTDYREALSLQHQYELEVASNTEDRILGLEHPQVITLGKRSKLDPQIPQGNVVWVDRGGEATLHSEGQLVIYPIVNLRERFSVREWVEILLATTAATLAKFGIQTERGLHAGLWTENGKIAFAGIRVRNHISTHGVSINVTNDISLLTAMKSCGVVKPKMDSFKKRGVEVSTRAVFEEWGLQFLKLTQLPATEKALIAPEGLVNFPELSRT